MNLRKVIATGFLSMSLLFIVSMASPQRVSAARLENCQAQSGSLLTFPTWYKYLDYTWDPGKQECDVRAQLPEDAGKILAAVFEIMLRVVSIVSIIFVIYGGIQYIISQGEPENIKNARTTIFNALIGLLVSMLATVIVNLIAGSIA